MSFIKISDVQPTLRFRKVVLSADDWDAVSSDAKTGDVALYAPEQQTYVYNSDTASWLPLGQVENTSTVSNKQSKYIVERCPVCNGPIKKLSDEDITKGHVRCEYCESIINLFREYTNAL